MGARSSFNTWLSKTAQRSLKRRLKRPHPTKEITPWAHQPLVYIGSRRQFMMDEPQGRSCSYLTQPSASKGDIYGPRGLRCPLYKVLHFTCIYILCPLVTPLSPPGDITTGSRSQSWPHLGLHTAAGCPQVGHQSDVPGLTFPPPCAGYRAYYTTAYSAYGAASHRKRCRFFSPSPPPAVPARLQAALAPLRTPPHSGERAGAVGRVGGSRRGTNDGSVHMGPLCVENAAVFFRRRLRRPRPRGYS